MSEAKFTLGQTVTTPNALSQLTYDDIATGLMRHVTGDWGDVDKHDRRANNLALQNGSRLLSVYRASTGIKFWIITEHDRSVTTVLLPEDY